MASELTQIIYDESQRKACYPFAEVYFNHTLTVYFENAVIVDVVSDSQAAKIAVCSWRLKEKMRWYIGRPREITEELLNSDYEVMSFTKNTKYHNMIAAADRWHPGFRDTMSKLCSSIGAKMPNEVKIPIYQNHFSAKREIYQDYVRSYLIPAMEVMKNDPEISKLARVNSKYSELDKSSPEKLKSLKEKIGIDYYPMAPFLLERLFSIYVHNNRINVTHL
jgi:hypothetical protein